MSDKFFDRNTSWDSVNATPVNMALGYTGDRSEETLDQFQTGYGSSFFAESLIATKQGLIPVSALAVGTLVLTRDHGFQPVAGVVRIPSRPSKTAVKTVFIRQGALGCDLPSTDIYVPANQLLLVLDTCPSTGLREYLALAEDLIQDRAGMRYQTSKSSKFSILFDAHEIIMANGLWLSSSFKLSGLRSTVLTAAQRKLLVLDEPLPVTISRPILTSSQAKDKFARTKRTFGIYNSK